jgi:type I restriction enzyme, S subunit
VKWASATLSEVAALERNSISPADIKSGSRYVGLDHIEAGGGSIRFGSVTNGELASNKFQFGPNHILFGKLRPYLAKVVCPDFDGICSTDIIPIAPSKNIEKRFLLHFLRLPETIAWAAGRATGVNLPRLSPKELASLEIPLPPLDEQRRIAAILDKADALRRKRKRTLDLLDNLNHSIFIEAFGNRHQQSTNYPVVEVGTVTSCIVPGRDKPKSFTGLIPWITTAEVNHLASTDAVSGKLGLTPDEIAQVRAKVIPPASVLLTCVGDLGIASIAAIPMVINQQLHSFQCSNRITPEYLMFALSYQKEYMYKRATKTTLPYMNKSVCNSIPVPLPPVEAQKTFGRLIAQSVAIKLSMRASLTKCESAFSSIQSRAFSGQL